MADSHRAPSRAKKTTDAKRSIRIITTHSRRRRSGLEPARREVRS
jgi:hypothetical protein